MKDIQFEATLRGHPMLFHTTWGIFSPKHIDEGTLCLLDHIKVDKEDAILDLGCGYGPIGLSLAKETTGSVHMVDKDFVAIEYAQKNAEANGIKNAEIYLSNAFRDVPKDQKFDIVVSNIPAKVGKELLEQIITDAKKRLNKGGRLYVVTIAGLRDYMKRQFKSHFGNYKKLKQSKGYCVALAERT